MPASFNESADRAASPITASGGITRGYMQDTEHIGFDAKSDYEVSFEKESLAY